MYCMLMIIEMFKCDEMLQKCCPEEKLLWGWCQLFNMPLSLPLTPPCVCWRYQDLFSSLLMKPFTDFSCHTVYETSSTAWDNSSQLTWQFNLSFANLQFLSFVLLCCAVVQEVMISLAYWQSPDSRRRKWQEIFFLIYCFTVHL